MILIRQLVRRTNAKIVLSSAWRLHQDYLTLASKLFAMNGIELFDVTRRAMKDCSFAERAHEIRDWLDSAPAQHGIVVSSWVAIDDVDLFIQFPSLFGNHFIQTNQYCGFRIQDYIQAYRLLTGKFPMPCERCSAVSDERMHACKECLLNFHNKFQQQQQTTASE